MKIPSRSRSICSRARTGDATRTVPTAVTTSNAIAMTAARTPTRPSDCDAAIDPTFATSMDTTRGMTVMRMRLTKIVPTGVAIFRTLERAVTVASAGFALFEQRAGVWLAAVLIVALLVWSTR